MVNLSFDDGGNQIRIARLGDRGVDVWGPDRVFIGPEVPDGSIEPGATLYNGTFRGEGLQIGKGSVIGKSGHAYVSDCQIGRDVELGAGTYEGATFLDRATVRGFAEVRPGTLLEEDTEAAHSAAFKNTILTATCVCGSLINYCDLFMSGGTSREDHSEVGSGAIHFNFDPRGDKWGSLIGDVRGVLMRSAPIFVGGQCGLVGPLHVDFGAVLAAGSVVRRDVKSDRVRYVGVEDQEIEGFDREIYTGLRRKFRSTARLIGNLWALVGWYEQVRLAFAEEYQRPLYESAQEQARRHIAERVKRLRKIVAKLPRSLEKSEGSEGFEGLRAEHRLLMEREEQMVAALEADPGREAPVGFVGAYGEQREESEHVGAVKRVDDEAATAAAEWLEGMAGVTLERFEGALG